MMRKQRMVARAYVRDGIGERREKYRDIYCGNQQCEIAQKLVCCNETRRGRRLAGVTVEAEAIGTGLGMAQMKWCVQGC